MWLTKDKGTTGSEAFLRQQHANRHFLSLKASSILRAEKQPTFDSVDTMMENMKSNVLIFPGGTEIANEIISSLEKNKSFNIILASSEKPSYCDYRKTKIHKLPFVTDENFIKKINLLIEEQNIEFIIPAHDDVAYSLSRNKKTIKAKIIGQSYEINKIVRHKDRTYDFFRGKIPTGKIYENIEKIDSYPIFIKPKTGQGSKNSLKINSREEFDTFFTSTNTTPNDFVIMEYFTGTEYTIDCFSENGHLLYHGARTREKTLKGISIISSLVINKQQNEILQAYANKISKILQMHGVWFFQMMQDSDKNLKLLEIGPRVSGSMMLNRMRGMNFIEAALHQAKGLKIEIAINDINVSIARALTPLYKHDYKFKHLYIDFDDTLIINNKDINADLMRLIFECKNNNIPVTLITKNTKNNLAENLRKFGIINIFDSIIHLSKNEKKSHFMKKNSLLIDDSFSERQQAISAGFQAVNIDIVKAITL